MVKLLLIGIGLFLFSCDGGGDEDNVTVLEIEGDWLPVDSCIEYSGNCLSVFQDFCEDPQNDHDFAQDGIFVL
tara:strand:- start:239 stop:457 length:219 start_codon:yes stop_codon:yes gene_type:complete